MRAKSISVFGVFWVLGAGSLAAQVQVEVVDSSGRPVSEVEVVAFDGVNEQTGLTDQQGVVTIELEPGLDLRASKRGFGETITKVAAGTREVQLRLPLTPYSDELVVAAVADTLGVPETASLATVTPDEQAGNLGNVTDLVARAPGVSQNGQGGLFQTFSIRGQSRHRILTLVDGVRIVSERRAGSSTSFVDPRLVEGIEVLRGPTSSRFGSGALGGVVNLVPKTWEEARVGAGWNSDGDAAWGKLAWGDADTSVAGAYRRSGDGETPDGDVLFSRYKHASLSASHLWGDEDRAYRLRVLGTRGRDIGKVSTDFPERETLYQEDHWVARFLASGVRHTVSASTHPSRVDAEVSEGPAPNVVVNRARDWSLSWNRAAEISAGTILFGADAFGRNGVEATETEGPMSTTTLDGRQLESSGFATWDWQTERSTLSAGGRWTVLDQGQRGVDSESESAGSGFVGWALDLGRGWDARAQVGSAWRFASLSERFFVGTTGRGQVVGNPNLDPERSLSGELGLRWTGKRAYTELSFHHAGVDDYIERVDAGDIRTFVNLDSGDVHGLELAGSWRLDRQWTLDWGGHTLDGEADSGAPLADIPPDRGWLAATWGKEAWSVRGRLEQRLAKGDPASGESALDSTTLGSVRVEYGHRLGSFALTVDNLFDETYRSAADDKLPEAAGRAFGVSWRWSPGPPPAQ